MSVDHDGNTSQGGDRDVGDQNDRGQHSEADGAARADGTARDDATARGSCLCGGVRWHAARPLRAVLECHCARCQKATGNYMAATAAPSEQLTIDATTLRWYSPPADPNIAYGFCTTCGASLFWRSGVADGTARVTSICVGSVDGPSGLATAEIWHADNAADHVRLDPSIPTFTAADDT